MLGITSTQGVNVNYEVNDLEYDESLLDMDVKVKRVGDKTVLNVRSELV